MQGPRHLLKCLPRNHIGEFDWNFFLRRISYQKIHFPRDYFHFPLKKKNTFPGPFFSSSSTLQEGLPSGQSVPWLSWSLGAGDHYDHILLGKKPTQSCCRLHLGSRKEVLRHFSSANNVGIWGFHSGLEFLKNTWKAEILHGAEVHFPRQLSQDGSSVVRVRHSECTNEPIMSNAVTLIC